MPPSHDYLMREFAIELLASGRAFTCLKHDDLQEPLRIAPHHHEHLLQLDLIRGCSGRVFANDRWLAFTGELALVAYPGVTHGYTLEPQSHSAAVLHFKIPTEPDASFAKHRALPELTRLPDDRAPLFPLAETILAETSKRRVPTAEAVLDLARLLAAWPRRGGAEGLRGTAADVHPLVEDAVTLIEEHLDDPPSLEALAEELDVSGRHLSRLFVAATGVTPNAYAAQRRLALAKSRLLSGTIAIADVALDLGFSGPATFTRWFRRETGTTPSEFRSDPTVF